MARKKGKAPSSRDIKKMLYSEKKYKKSKSNGDEKGLMVIVENDNITLALKRLKKKLKDNNVFEELKEKERYVKPSTKRRRKLSLIKCKRKWDKILRERLELLESSMNNG